MSVPPRVTLVFKAADGSETHVELEQARYRNEHKTALWYTPFGVTPPPASDIGDIPVGWQKLTLFGLGLDTNIRISFQLWVHPPASGGDLQNAYVVVPPNGWALQDSNSEQSSLPGVMLAVKIRGSRNYTLVLPRLDDKYEEAHSTVGRMLINKTPGTNLGRFYYNSATQERPPGVSNDTLQNCTLIHYYLSVLAAQTIAAHGAAHGNWERHYFLIKSDSDVSNASSAALSKQSWEEAFDDNATGRGVYRVGENIGIRRGTNWYFMGPNDRNTFEVKRRDALTFAGVHYNSVSTVPSTTRCVLSRDATLGILGISPRASGDPAALGQGYFELNPADSGGRSEELTMLLRVLYNNGEPIISGSRVNQMTEPALVNVRGPRPGGIMTLCRLEGFVRWSPVALRSFSMLQRQCRALHRCDGAACDLAAAAADPFEDMNFVLRPKNADEAVVFAEAVRACVVHGKTWDDGGRSFKDRSVVKRADQALARHVEAVVKIVRSRPRP